MATSFKAVLRVKYSTDTVGTVNIRKIVDTKPTYYSMKIKVPVKYWNKRTGMVRKNDVIDYQGINNQIEDKLKEFETFGEQPEYQPTPSKLSFIGFFNSYLSRYDNVGTRIKYETVLHKLKAYLKHKGKSDLLFHEINSDVLYDFRNFARGKVSINTATHYLKLIKQVLKNAIALNQYTYIRDPFLGMEFKTVKVEKSALEESELRKLIDTYIPESDPLFTIRQCFIAQVFLQGMRVSDLQLLRYSMIKGDCIEYLMHKTNTFMSVYVSDLVWEIFIHQYKKFLRKYNVGVTAIPRLERQLGDLKDKAIEILKSRGHFSTNNHDLVIKSFFKSSKDLGIKLDPVFQEIKDVQGQIFESYKQAIIYFGRANKDRFIFDFLQDVDFSNIKDNDFSAVTESQYKTIKNRSVVYNRHLKQLQERAGILTKLKSHLSRSTYASMLLNDSVNVYLISAALGHSGLNITEKYLAGFNRGITESVNKELAGKFYDG